MVKPAALYQSTLTANRLKEIFEESFTEGAAVGKDGVTLAKFSSILDDEIAIIVSKVNSGTYRFTSYKEKLILKGPHRPPRQVSISTIRDRLTLKWLSKYLSEVYPEHVSRLPHETIKRVHTLSSSSPAEFNFLRLDVENFFPSINHEILLRIIRRKIRKRQIISLISSAITTPTGLPAKSSSTNRCGVPQGLSISNILSSIYLSDVDETINKLADVNYFRYVDDILVIGPDTRTRQLSSKLPKLLMATRKMSCHPVNSGGKSQLVPVAEGLDYLGYNFRGDNIEVRSASYKKMFSALMQIVSGMKYARNRGPLIWKLNLRITGCKFQGRRVGWLFFFSQSKNLQQLKRLDAFLVKQVKGILAPQDQERLKRLVKTYYEIRYNSDATTYVPDFDNFTDEQKRAQIAILIPRKPRAEIDILSSEELDALFRRCIRREIADLERDMLEAFS